VQFTYDLVFFDAEPRPAITTVPDGKASPAGLTLRRGRDTRTATR
jgi:hypothetical protein